MHLNASLQCYCTPFLSADAFGQSASYCLIVAIAKCRFLSSSIFGRSACHYINHRCATAHTHTCTHALITHCVRTHASGQSTRCQYEFNVANWMLQTGLVRRAPHNFNPVTLLPSTYVFNTRWQIRGRGYAVFGTSFLWFLTTRRFCDGCRCRSALTIALEFVAQQKQIAINKTKLTQSHWSLAVSMQRTHTPLRNGGHSTHCRQHAGRPFALWHATMTVKIQRAGGMRGALWQVTNGKS